MITDNWKIYFTFFLSLVISAIIDFVIWKTKMKLPRIIIVSWFTITRIRYIDDIRFIFSHWISVISHECDRLFSYDSCLRWFTIKYKRQQRSSIQKKKKPIHEQTVNKTMLEEFLVCSLMDTNVHSWPDTFYASSTGWLLMQTELFYVFQLRML